VGGDCPDHTQRKENIGGGEQLRHRYREKGQNEGGGVKETRRRREGITKRKKEEDERGEGVIWDGKRRHTKR